MNRIAKLESAKFALYFGDRIRDELSDMQAAMLAFFVENRDDAEAGRLLREFMTPHINHTLKFLEERYPELPAGEGPSCSTGYGAEYAEEARLDQLGRARAFK